MAPIKSKGEASKILMIGANGSGKTGSLVSLARAGYNIRVLDFDNGAEILYQLTKGEPEVAARFDVETHTDDYKSQAGVVQPVTPLKGFANGMKVLDNWPGFGNINTWGPDTVLVLDSMTMMGKFIMNHILFLNAHLGQNPQLQHWGAAMSIQEDVMARLYSPTVKCHVIVMAHITFLEPEGEAVRKAYPSALGNKLPPKIGSYFNSTLHVGVKGSGANQRRVISTKSTNTIDLKTPAPGLVKDEYPIETGLADYFKDLHGPLKAA